MAIGSFGSGPDDDRISGIRAGLFAPGLGTGGGARRDVTEHADRLIESGAILFVEHGMDERGRHFGRDIVG